MIILGIDPSLAGMGWGVIDTDPLKYLDSGVIKTKSSEAMHKWLEEEFQKSGARGIPKARSQRNSISPEPEGFQKPEAGQQ